nr:retrovirus-related Pol polyprotein from transposon TNT 1-94 [Tanacetum cinerariifolium]
EPEKIIEMEEDADDKSMEILTVEQLLDEIPKLKDQIMHDFDESAGYESMPGDDLRSVSGFKGADSDDTQGNDVSRSDNTFPDQNASAERKELVVHNSEEKKSKEIISVEDDKQPLSKRFKIMTPIPDIQNPTPLNTFVPEHLLKPKEQQKSIQEFTDQLFKTTFSRFSPTPPRKITPPIDSSKGKALKSFTTPEGPLSQEEYNNQIKEIKRLNDLKAEQEKSEQELRKLFNPTTLKANRLGLPPPPELATFGLTSEKKKRERTKLIKEAKAVTYVCHLVNRLTSTAIDGKKPFEKWDVTFNESSKLKKVNAEQLDGTLKKVKFERIIVLADREPGDNSPMVEGDYEEEEKEGFPGQDDVHYKARLVAKGYAQKEGIDHNAVFFQWDVTFNESAKLKKVNAEQLDGTLKKVKFERIIVLADREPGDNSPMVEGDYEEEEFQSEEPRQQQHESVATSKPKRNTKRHNRFNDTVACASSIAVDDVPTTYSEAVRDLENEK